MKSIFTFVLLVIPLPLLSQSQTKVAPDCNITLQPRTTTGLSVVFDNRPQSSATGIPCTEWILVASATTANVSFSVQAESAQDNGVANCAGCTFNLFGAALTAEGITKIKTSYGDFLHVNLTAINSGTVSAFLLGWRDNATSIAGGGGTNCVGAFTNGSIVFAQGGTCTQDNTNLFFDNTLKEVRLGTQVFASIGTPSNATTVYCSNCTVTSSVDNTCAGAGSGAWAFRINGAWKCVL